MNDTELDVENTALVIIDLQRGYCDPTSDLATTLGWQVEPCEEVCRKHVGFLANIRKLMPPKNIIWLRMEENAATFASNSPFQKFITHSRTKLLRGTPGHDYHIVKPNPGEPEFFKAHLSAFHSQEFADYLLLHNIKNLIVTGVYISRCINSTVVVGSALGYRCIVPENLVANPTNLQAEAEHHLNVIKLFHAEVTKDTDGLIAQLCLLNNNGELKNAKQ